MTQDQRMVAWYEKTWPPVYGKGVAEGLDGLREKEQVLFLVGYLIDQLCNGGTFMVYYNPSAEYVVRIASALQMIGATRAARVMREINALFPGGAPSSIHETREQQLKALPEEAWEKGAELEGIFGEWLPDSGGRVMLKQLYDYFHAEPAAAPDRPRD
jgi:hypothetical protein